MNTTKHQVDPLVKCSTASIYEASTMTIYEDPNGLVWNAMLNFTNISYGSFGNNKFYLVQLIQNGFQYLVFRKWGRVGTATPQTAMDVFYDLENAKAAFQKYFKAKTGNSWPLEGPFKPVKGKYVLVELQDDEEQENQNRGGHKMSDTQPSKLPEQVQELIKLISNGNLIAQEMTAMNFDLKRMPLGRLSKNQISRGYTVLRQISDALEQIKELENPRSQTTSQSLTTTRATRSSTRGKTVTIQPSTTTRVTRSNKSGTAAASEMQSAVSPAKSKNDAAIRKLKHDIKAHSSAFYTLIPHDFGRTLPPAIDTMDALKQKISLLEVLADVEISQNLEKAQAKAGKDGGSIPINPIDAQYNMLNAEMEPLSETDEEFKIIERYVATTHAPTHSGYKLKIHSILKILRPNEGKMHDIFQQTGNHRLLWHGSRLSNMVGIISQGLRVAPPEAPHNGYMFGKGIYFADSVSKSANYCWTSQSQPKGVLFLAEVALGRQYQAREAEKLTRDTIQTDKKSDSLHGVGRMASHEQFHETMKDGVVVPSGQLAATGDNHSRLLYNEFVVYRPEQVKLRYVINMDFLYDNWANSISPLYTFKRKQT